MKKISIGCCDRAFEVTAMPTRLLLSLSQLLLCSWARDYPTWYMEDYCGYDSGRVIWTAPTGLNSSGVMTASRTRNYGRAQNCQVILKAGKGGHGIVLALDDISLRFGERGDCVDFLQVSVHEDDGWEDVMTSCYASPRQAYSSERAVRLTFHSDPSCCTYGGGFRLTYTAYKIDSCPSSDSFECANGRCIWDRLVCDLHNNCGDNSDEWLHDYSNCARSKTTVAIVAVVCSIIGLVIVCAVCICVCRHCKRRRAPAPSAPQNYGSIKDSQEASPRESPPPPYYQPAIAK